MGNLLDQPLLKPTGSGRAWHPDANRGLLVWPNGTEQHVVFFREASPLIGGANALPTVPGVVPLLGVLPVNGHLVRVYKAQEAFNLSHLQPNELPNRALCDLMAQLARILVDLAGTGVVHPGPQLSDLLLIRSGGVQLFDFSKPKATRTPNVSRGHPEQKLAHQLGELLLSLTQPPPARPLRAWPGASKNTSPNPIDLHGWIHRLQAPNPSHRPALAEILEAFADQALAQPGPCLETWVTAHFDEHLTRVRTLPRAKQSPAAPSNGRSIQQQPYLSGDSDWVGANPDDHTEEAPSYFIGLNSPLYQVPPPGRARTFPVQVGPPAKVVATVPHLPSEFLKSVGGCSSASTCSPTWATRRRIAMGLWILASALLLVVVLLLLTYLVFGW